MESKENKGTVIFKIFGDWKQQADKLKKSFHN